MSHEKREMLPAIYGEKLPEIPQETLDKLLKTAEQNTILASVKKDGGFEVKGAWFRELVGVICSIDPYLIRWEGKEPSKLPYLEDELDWPEGYKPGANITILTTERLKIQLSLSKSSFQYELCDYVKFLNGRSLKPTEVITRFTTKEVHGQFGTYIVVKPSLAEQDDVVDLSAPQSVKTLDSYPGADDEIPF